MSATPLREIPTVRGAPLVGSTLAFAKDTIKAIMDGWHENGDLARFRVPMSLCVVAHPDDVKYVLQENHRNYIPVDWVSDAWRLVVGEGLLASSGDYWLRQRRIEQPGFHRQRIAGFATLMSDIANETVERWRPASQSGRYIELKSEMTHLTLDVLAKAMFSASWDRDAEKIPPAVTVELEFMFRQLKSPVSLPLFVPTPGNRKFLEARASLDEMVYRLIAERRSSGEDPGDLLSMLINARDPESGEQMTDQQIRDEIMTLIFAGHETVSCGLVWTWFLLAKHPDVLRRLQEEVDEVLGGRRATIDDLPKLEYTWMVIQEAMRLYPPVWPIAREPVTDDTVGGYRVPAGSMLLILPYVTHRHPDFWENPEGFNPDRFSPANAEGRHRWAYFPFSGGPRKCIGDYFATMEMQLAVATLAQHYELHLQPGLAVVPQPGITLRPKDPVLMKVVSRQ